MKLSSQLLMDISDLPSCPALYALFGGTGKRKYVAYVGIADSLKRRAAQHLLNRDSSVATGTAAVGINPDYVTEIQWWEHRRFLTEQRWKQPNSLPSIFLIRHFAAESLFPRLALQLFKKITFKKEMQKLPGNNPAGSVSLPSLDKVARRLSRVEARLEEIEKHLKLGLSDRSE
jgi:hypothetical protein